MRDPSRIDELVELLRRAWRRVPDQRLGQLLVNVARPTRPAPEIFHLEDTQLRRALLRFESEASEPPQQPLTSGATLSWEEVGAPAASTVRLQGARLATFEVGQLFCQVLEVQFSGEYRHGSQGNPDADAMALALSGLLLRTEPDVLLLDLSQLHYAWGDGIMRVLDSIGRFDKDYPVEVVLLAGPESEGGLKALGAAVHLDANEALEAAKALAVKRTHDIG